MRGFGAFQRAQMRDTDPRVHQLFNHVRQAVDLLEQLVLRPAAVPAPEQPKHMEPKSRPSEASEISRPPKLAYTVKEACELIGIGRSMLYQAFRDHELRAVMRNAASCRWKGTSSADVT